MIQDLSKRVLQYASQNSPAILTAIGVVGVTSTGYFGYKAGIEVERITQECLGHPDAPWNQEGRDMTRKEVFDATWEAYVPPVVTGVTTIAAIVTANRISANRASAMATAFTVSQQAMQQYREKVVEHIGKNKEQKVRDAVAQDRVTNHPTANTMVVTGGSVLCMDGWTGRVFEIASVEELKKAQNDLNHQMLYDDTQTLSDFYDRMGWEHTAESDMIGWNNHNNTLMELEISTTQTKDQKPCFVINYSPAPSSSFQKR